MLFRSLFHDINFNFNFDDTSMFELRVEQGKVYLLRIVNANLISEMFMKVAKHMFTVVAVDAGTPTRTSVRLLLLRLAKPWMCYSKLTSLWDLITWLSLPT